MNGNKNRVRETTTTSETVLADSGGSQGILIVSDTGEANNIPIVSYAEETVYWKNGNNNRVRETTTTSETVLVDSGGSQDIPILLDTGEANDIPIVSDAEESVSNSEKRKSDSDSEISAEELSNENTGSPLRRSARKQPRSKMSLLVIALAMMASGSSNNCAFENIASIDNPIPIVDLPETNVQLEQDFGSCFLKEVEMRKLRELQMLD